MTLSDEIVVSFVRIFEADIAAGKKRDPCGLFRAIADDCDCSAAVVEQELEKIFWGRLQ